MDDEILHFPDTAIPRGPVFWVVVEDRDQVELYCRVWKRGSDDPFRAVCWADLPAKAAEVEQLIVYGHANTHSGFRKADRLEHDLGFLGNLRSLDVPTSFVRGLDPGALPASLRRLAVGGNGRASFDAGRVFPGIVALEAWPGSSSPDNQVRFGPGAFPDLRELTCRLDPKGALLDVVATYPSLAILEIGPIKDPGTFGRLAGVAVESLAIGRGSLATLDGIERVRGLRNLSIKAMDRLVDIAALGSCEGLETVSIHHCANLADHRPLLTIPNLKSVYLFRCNALDPEKCAADLATRPGLLRRIWACTGSRRKP